MDNEEITVNITQQEIYFLLNTTLISAVTMVEIYKVAFSMKRAVWRMRNEAGFRPMKRGFAARRG